MKISFIILALIVFIRLSCKESMVTKNLDKTAVDNPDIIKTDSSSLKINSNNYYTEILKIDTETCMDKSRPNFGYLKIGDNISTVKIVAYFDTTADFTGKLQNVNILDSISGKLIQRIDYSDIKLRKKSIDDKIYFTELHFNYYNLDDYIDIYLLQDCGAHGPCSGYYFLYDKSTGKYIYAKEYENLFDICVNKKRKLIYNFSNSGNGYWTFETYKRKGNKLYLIEEESLKPVESDDNSELYKYARRKRNSNGKLLMIETFDTSQVIEPKYFKDN